MKIDGRCHCGEITFRAEIADKDVEICHCTDCQTLSGSAYRTVAPAKEGTFELLSGELSFYEKTGENGSTRVQTFCPNCGTPIYSSPPNGAAGFFGIRVGSIVQREELIPTHQIWFRSALAWTQDLSAMGTTDKQ